MARGKRGKGAEYWQATVQSWSKSGLSQVEFCRRRNLTLSTFRWWCRKLKNGDRSPQTGRSSKSKDSLFIPVHVRGELPQSSFIEIHLPGDRWIRIPRGFDPETLKEVLAVLEERAC